MYKLGIIIAWWLMPLGNSICMFVHHIPRIDKHSIQFLVLHDQTSLIHQLFFP